jgi:thiol-disulfide isomerase/thioredoxin
MLHLRKHCLASVFFMLSVFLAAPSGADEGAKAAVREALQPDDSVAHDGGAHIVDVPDESQAQPDKQHKGDAGDAAQDKKEEGDSSATSKKSPAEKQPEEQKWSIVWSDPKPAEDITLRFEKESLPLSAYKGKIVLMNFWAIWCAPCVKELPSLAQLYSDFQHDGIQVVAVAQEAGGFAKLNPFWHKQHVDMLPLAWDARSELMYHYAISGLPTTLIFDRQGRLRGKIEGAVDWQSEYFQHFITNRLLTLK